MVGNKTVEHLNNRIQVEHNRNSYLEEMKMFHADRMDLERKLIDTEHQVVRNDLDDKDKHQSYSMNKDKVSHITKEHWTICCS